MTPDPLDDALNDAFEDMVQPSAVVTPLPIPPKEKPLLERDPRAKVAFEYLRYVGFTALDYERYMREYLGKL